MVGGSGSDLFGTEGVISQQWQFSVTNEGFKHKFR